MAKKGEYSPKSGPFAGQTFRSYFAYQQALAQSMGFRGYSEQRRVMGISLVQTLVNRAIASGAMSRTEAVSSVRQWWTDQDYKGRSARVGAQHSEAQGRRKHNAIAWAIDNGIYDAGDDAAEDIPY